MFKNGFGFIFIGACFLATGETSSQVALSQPGSDQVTHKGKTLQEWITALQSKDRDTRIAASEALLALGTQAKSAIPLLIRALEDSDPLVRYNATLALGKMGPDALTELKKAGNSQNQTTQYYINAALKRLGSSPATTGNKKLKQEKSFQGKLDQKDPLDTVRKQCFCKVHTFDMTTGDVYVIDLQSKDFDSFLRLENAAKKQLAQDDDGGGFPHARITFTAPETGTYRIIVTTFAPNKTGEYSLTVKQFSGSGK